MRLLCSIIFLLIHLQAALCEFEWPQGYHFKAEKIDLVQGLASNIEVWWDGDHETEQFRLDVNNVKHYLVDGEGFKVHTEADLDGEATKEECVDDEDLTEPTDLLPDLTDFHLAGNVLHNNIEVDVWIYTKHSDQYSEKLTLYIKNQTPIRYEEIKLTLKDGPEIHTVYNFLSYDSNVNLNAFKQLKKQCLDYVSKYNINGPSDIDRAFKLYKKIHRKKYHPTEHETRKSIFEKNLRLVKQHNSENHSYKLAMNRYADLTPQEKHYLTPVRDHEPSAGSHPFPHSEADLQLIATNLPENFDLRMDGVISRVKNQGNICGSCWAFATTAVVEGVLSQKYHGYNLDLSEQALVDCAYPYGVFGCGGGFSSKALQFVMDHGIPTEKDYGDYLADEGKCHINSANKVYNITGYVAVTPMSVNALKTAVYKYGPVAIYVEVTDKMLLYSSGIYYETSNRHLHDSTSNHVVALVGYGKRDEHSYWIVKNSYGESWGEDGYILISNKDNMGSVLSEPYYVFI